MASLAQRRALTCRRAGLREGPAPGCRRLQWPRPTSPTSSRSSDWVTKTRAFRSSSGTASRAIPRSRHLPVCGPSLVHRESRAAARGPLRLPGLRQPASLPRGHMPLANFDDERTIMSLVSGSKPLVSHRGGLPRRREHRRSPPGGVRGGEREVHPAHRARGLPGRHQAHRSSTNSPTLHGCPGRVQGDRRGRGLVRAPAKRPHASAVLHRPAQPDPHRRGSSAAVAPAPEVSGLASRVRRRDMRQLLLRSADGTYSLVALAPGEPLGPAPASAR